MAQGFLVSLDKNEELEDTGENYIDELVRRSFFQHEGGEVYKMHDLVHDLAEYVAGSECLNMKGENTMVIKPDNVRHVSFDSSSYCNIPRPLIQAKLRTIIFPSKRRSTFGSSIETIFSSFPRLRFLNFNNPYVEDELSHRLNFLPKNIGNLKHLRFLNINYCYGMQTLPKGFGNSLINLQYLNLHGSALCELPEDFGELIQLRALVLSSMMTCLPEKQIGGLTSLRELHLYDSFELTSLGEGIGKLTHLRKLEIKLCPLLTSVPVGMRYLTALEHLEISYCFALNFSEEDFQGLRNLKSLILTDLLRLVTLPKGLQDSAATLNQLKLQNCENFVMVPDFDVLPNLTSLCILEFHCCDNLLSLPKQMQHLTTLHRLRITGCRHLSRRCKEGIGEDWPKIAHIPQVQID